MIGITVIGCKLPHGPCMELGIAQGGAPGPNYKYAIVLGVDDVAPKLLVGPKDGKYAITRVPTDLADAWFKANAKSRYVLDKSVFVIK